MKNAEHIQIIYSHIYRIAFNAVKNLLSFYGDSVKVSEEKMIRLVWAEVLTLLIEMVRFELSISNLFEEDEKEIQIEAFQKISIKIYNTFVKAGMTYDFHNYYLQLVINRPESYFMITRRQKKILFVFQLFQFYLTYLIENETFYIGSNFMKYEQLFPETKKIYWDIYQNIKSFIIVFFVEGIDKYLKMKELKYYNNTLNKRLDNYK